MASIDYIHKMEAAVIRKPVVALVVLFAASCGGGLDDGLSTLVATPPLTGLWISGGATGAGLATFRDRATAVNAAPEVTTVRADSGSAASGTYTLEANVDEHDILKYDGGLMAVAPSRTACCFVLARTTAGESTPSKLPSRAIQLFRTEPAAGRATALSRVELGENESVEGLYLGSGRLQALMSDSWFGTFGDALRVAVLWQSRQTRLVTYDISAPAAPRALTDLKIEGALVASRRSGGQILLVTRHTPVIKGLIAQPTTENAVAANQVVLASIKDSDVLPRITQNGGVLDVLKLDNCLRQDMTHRLAIAKPQGMIVTTLLGVSASTGTVLQASCILEPITGVYVSPSAILLTWVDSSSAKYGTYVHQLRLRDHAYQGSVRVRGQLHVGGNADFRISESNGIIRLLTTELTGDPADQFDHRLFTLKASTTLPEIDVLATLPAEGDAEIGKPNEDLYGVRFLQNRAYLVTFERIDPLYVIDLSDPARPQVSGTLEVPGLSDLLHPVNDSLLLGVGRTADSKAKVELFNIQNPAVPTSLGSVELGSGYAASFSPAQYNRYAFTYLADEPVDRFTIPYTAWRTISGVYQNKSAIALFEISGKASPSTSRLKAVGEVSLPVNGVSADTRTVVDQDALFVWGAQTLLGGFWSNPETLTPQGRW
ncbi:MAG: hypothetical protein FJ196_06795 [Gammaproteobacteria bacterium]|nr:hypothetical protein [Gammaproteobacteria bacterium]